MEANQTNPSQNKFETLMSDSYLSKDFDWDKDLKENTSTFLSHYSICIEDEEDEDSEDHVLILAPRLEPTGFSQTSCKEDVLMFVNAGIIVQFGGQTPLKLALPIKQYLNEHKLFASSGAGYVRIWGTSPDSIDAAEDRERFNAILNELKIEQPKGGIGKSGADVKGGNLIRTDESIINGGDLHPSIDQSARSGNFSYRFESLPPGDYFVDLHFAEITYTNGPKGMRVFNVFLQGEKLKDLVDVELYLSARSLSQLTTEDMYELKKRGFSDKQIAFATKSTEKDARIKRLSLGVAPAYKRVDTCAAEFEANTPYMYSCYDNECESPPTKRRKMLILGGGPNRIGQGIEFDYCCCHTSFALQEAGFETIMMNSNPETVSTDYDTRNRLYFETLTVEDVLNIINLERPDGIIAQFLGQTPLKLALPIEQYLNEHKLLAASGAGYVRIWGTSPDSIDAAEDRERFNAILNELKIEQPKGGIAKSGADVEGGNLIRTDESIINGGDIHLSIYQSARSGNFSYRFESLPPGDYFVDLHFAEIISQVLSELDIYSVVEANKPLQLLDARVSVGEDVEIELSFKGVHGSPVVSRICIRRAPKPPDPRSKSTEKDETKIEDLTNQSQLKSNECYEAWMYKGNIIFLATFPPPGGLSFSAAVGSAASTSKSGGHPPEKKRGNLTGGGGKDQVSLRYLKFKFSVKEPKLESMVIAYQWVRGCFLENEVGRWKIRCKLIPQDWMLHGLWPPPDADQCYDDFDAEKIRRFLDDLLHNWASLKRDSGDVEGHIRFWKKQWLKHGVKSRLSQKLYMKLALELHGRYKHLLTDAMNIAKSSESASASFDSALGTDIFTINTSDFESAVGRTLAAPKLKWIELGENKYALKEVQLKISLLADDYEVHDMDNRGAPPLELIV